MADKLLPVVSWRIKPDNIINFDGYHSYDVLDISDFHHYRIDHSEEVNDRKKVMGELYTIGGNLLKMLYYNRASSLAINRAG